MNVVDIIILIFLCFGLIIGWKNGFTKQLVSAIGFIIAIILSYFLKDIVASMFFKYMPFLDFNGVTVINIIFYEFLAFVITLSVLILLVKILLKVSTLFEKLLRVTIVLGIPSHILGAVIGALENFVISFIIIFFLNLPVFNFNFIRDSKFTKTFLNKKTILNTICNDSLELYDKVNELKDNAQDETDKTKVNNEILKLLIEYKMITKEDCNYLIEHEKLKNVRLEN